MMFGKSVLKYRADIIEKLSELVRIRSVGEAGTESAPFGPGPKKALDYTLELAKKSSTEKSSKFINGILSAIIKD